MCLKATLVLKNSNVRGTSDFNPTAIWNPEWFAKRLESQFKAIYLGHPTKVSSCFFSKFSSYTISMATTEWMLSMISWAEKISHPNSSLL
jgi:hypothetical protein